jgi:hypothetical protein
MLFFFVLAECALLRDFYMGNKGFLFRCVPVICRFRGVALTR